MTVSMLFPRRCTTAQWFCAALLLRRAAYSVFPQEAETAARANEETRRQAHLDSLAAFTVDELVVDEETWCWQSVISAWRASSFNLLPRLTSGEGRRLYARSSAKVQIECGSHVECC